jgi:hypothetical protein
MTPERVDEAGKFSFMLPSSLKLRLEFVLDVALKVVKPPGGGDMTGVGVGGGSIILPPLQPDSPAQRKSNKLILPRFMKHLPIQQLQAKLF